jgi:hypothetical protein
MYMLIKFVIQYTCCFSFHFKSKLSPSMNYMVWQVYKGTWCCELQCSEKLIIKRLENNYRIIKN